MQCIVIATPFAPVLRIGCYTRPESSDLHTPGRWSDPPNPDCRYIASNNSPSRGQSSLSCPRRLRRANGADTTCHFAEVPVWGLHLKNGMFTSKHSKHQSERICAIMESPEIPRSTSYPHKNGHRSSCHHGPLPQAIKGGGQEAESRSCAQGIEGGQPKAGEVGN